MPSTTSTFRVQINFVLGLFLNGFLLTVIGSLTTAYMTLATLSYSLLCWGLVLRTQRQKHALLMNLGIGLDIALVLALELQRGAIDTAMGLSLSPWQQAHIVCSTLAVLFYIPTAFLGWQRFRHPSVNQNYAAWHLRFGLAAFTCRTLGFALMFSLLSHVRGG